MGPRRKRLDRRRLPLFDASFFLANLVKVADGGLCFRYFWPALSMASC